MTTRIIAKDTISQYHTKNQDNIILIDKPATWSSFDVVKKIKNIGRFKKVGHAGTLDPFATGLLVLGTNKETKRLTDYSNDDKAYIGTIAFGETKKTYDITGETVTKFALGQIDRSKIENILQDMIGESEQVAPMFSAKKVDGVRLYKLAHKGKEIQRNPHKVTIFEIKIMSQKELDLQIYVKCSKGTYIRTLAHDIGQLSGYGAYLKELRRVSVNGFIIENALSITEFQNYWLALN